MPITVEVPNRGSIEFADGTSDADIDAIVAKEFPPTQEDSYQKVLGYEQLISDEVPTKEEFLAYSKVKKSKPLLGERPMETVGGAAVETAKFLATLPYRTGEAISETVIAPPEGVTRGEAVAGTAAEIAAQSALGAKRLVGGLEEFLTQKLTNDDDKYEAFLQLSDVKRKIAAAQNLVPEQRVPASQEFLQMFNIPAEAISPAGTEVGGFVSAPENIAFGVGGKVGGAVLGQVAKQIPRIGASFQRAGAATGAAARIPETLAGRAATALTGSEAAGEAVQRAVATGTTGLTTAEAIGIPVSGTLGIPGVGAASQFISGTKAIGAVGETLGEAAAASGGAGLTPIQQGMLGFGERIAASPTASTAARRLGTAIARTGIETPVKTAANILIPGLGAGAAGGLLAGLTGEEGDNVAAAIGSGIAFGGIEGGIRLAKASAAKGFDNARVRQAAVEDLNTRPNEVQFTYADPVAGDQTVTIKDRDARAEFYNKLQGDMLPKALSEVANAENAGVEVLFHRDADPIPQGIQQIKYKGVALKPADVRGGKPTILVNVDRASPETIPHELLHARLTDDIVRRAGAGLVQDSIDPTTGKLTQQGQQFQDFANAYANAIEKAGDPNGAARFRQELAAGFDQTQQRPQRIDSLKRLSDEMMAYYAQEFLAGKDPKTLLPGRIPSFWKNAFDLAKNAVADRFSQRALQAGFDPVARTFYDADGKRIKIPWMEDAINQLLVKGEGFIPKDQKVDLRGLTPAARSAVIIDRGYADMFMVNPDGSMGRPLTAREVSIKDADIAQRTIKLLDSLPQADRASVTGLDAKGNTIIEGRLSLKEAEALANSGIFSQSTSQFIKDIANAILNGDLLNGRYWKVYGKTGRSGVFPESEKAFLPYGISINSKGGVNIKIVDWTKVQSRMDKALKKAAYRNLFRSQEQAMSALRDVYLRNIAEQNAVPSAEALGGGANGARKRNFFNEVMGAVPKVGDVLINEPTAGYTASRKGGSVYEDLRIERVQDIEQTGTKIPWSGDMGEQSSYRRTQLNFQPAEKIGDASVQTDQNAGYRILSKNNKFRVYSPSGELAGIFDTEGQAKLKAEKLYATQARLQPQERQLQYPPRDEGGQTPEAGGRNRALGGQEGQGQGGPVRQAGDVGGRFMPDQQGFYSKLEEVVQAKLPKSATPQQILATVDPAKGSGVKAEELKWTGFAQAVERIAKENGGKVPKEKLMEHLQNEGRVRFEEVSRGGQRTEYSKYQLPGGESYREVVLTSDTAAPYTSSHFQDIPNYVAHMRLNERVDTSGKPGLFVEEIQSDRHQQAREKGYAEKTDWSKVPVYQYNDLVAGGIFPAVTHIEVRPQGYTLVSPDGTSLGFASSLEKLKSEYDSKATGIPDAPFRKDWSLQMFKRGLRDAVASGKEWIGWTTGDTQAARYDLSKQVDYIDYRMVGPDKYDVGVVGKDGSDLFSETGINQSRVADVVGKEIAEKMAKGEGQKGGGRLTLRGVDLQVGGEGMKGFYDKILPSEVQKYVKQWGGEVKKSNIPEAPIWRVDITPQMRDSIQRTGQPRFMPSDADYLAAVKAGDTAQAQRMVDEAAKASGYTVKAYHVTSAPAFTKFDPNLSYDNAFWFTTDKGAIERGETGASVSSDQRVIEAYLKTGKQAGWNEYDKSTPTELKNQGFDSVKLGSDIVVLDPTQIKSADPITRDSSGNVIPLSQRFQQSSADIRYMPSEKLESVVDGVVSEANRLGFEIADEHSSAFGSQYITIRDPESNREWKMRFSDHERQLSSVTQHAAPNFEQVGNLNLEAAVGWLRKKRETIDNPPKFDQKKFEERLQSKAQSEVRKYEQTIQDLEANRDKRIAQGNNQKAANLQSQIDQIKNSIGYKSAVNQAGQPRFMPSLTPDASIPGAYSMSGYRVLPGRERSKLRVYSPSGSLLGIASSADEAQRMILRKTR